MLKVDMDSTNRTTHTLEAKGDCKTMAAEIGVVIGGMYHQLKAMDDREAERFKSMILLMLMPAGPVWAKSPKMMGFEFRVQE